MSAFWPKADIRTVSRSPSVTSAMEKKRTFGPQERLDLGSFPLDFGPSLGLI